MQHMTRSLNMPCRISDKTETDNIYSIQLLKKPLQTTVNYNKHYKFLKNETGLHN